MPTPERQRYPARDLAQILAELLRTALRANGSWRIPEDAVDRTYNILIDRHLADSPPANLEGWLRTILWNHLKSGPDQTGLKRSRVKSLPEGVADLPKDGDVPRANELRARLDVVLQTAVDVLTEAESRALRALLSETTMAEAAKACGMTLRDLRVRRRRAIRKIRWILARERSH